MHQMFTHKIMNIYEGIMNQKNINFRRQCVLEHMSQGFTQRETSVILRCSEATISNDVRWIKKQCNVTINEYVHNLAYEFMLTLNGINSTIKELWKDIKNPESNDRVKQNAKGMLIHAYKQRVEILSATQPLDNMLKQLGKKKQDNKPQVPVVQNIKLLKDSNP
jgi:hypothetical protein